MEQTQPKNTDYVHKSVTVLWRWLLPTLVLIATLIVMALVSVVVISTRDPFGWDEAGHALTGLLFADDIRHGDWISFAFDSYRQVLYPPIYSWFLALGLLGFGASPATVSHVTLFFFGLGAVLLWIAGGQLDRRRPNITGALAALNSFRPE